MVILSLHLCAYLEPKQWPGISMEVLIHRQVFSCVCQCVSVCLPVCDLHSFQVFTTQQVQFLSHESRIGSMSFLTGVKEERGVTLFIRLPSKIFQHWLAVYVYVWM